MRMRRRGLLAGATLAAAGLVACVPRPEKRTAARSSSQFEYWPTERVQTFRVRPDGTLAVTVDLILDAGEGTDRPLRVTWPTRVQLHRHNDRFVDMRPELVEPAMVHTSSGGGALTFEPEPDERSLRVWAVPGPGGTWAPGRHRITLTHGTANTWLEVDGDPRLVLWALSSVAPWTDSGDSFLRVETEDQRWEATSDGTVAPVTDPYVARSTSDQPTYSFLRPELSVAPPPAPTRPR
ncbi:hypothetical protein [Granulicoccus phenolivorans]|uniref:hypothetical protein n=1 Tax=Granulicoccus phenolivorans TaxID=266854 RepID=UPI0003FD3801|nr:hypothetical protein [Granulicoccus phenolivorans]